MITLYRVGQSEWYSGWCPSGIHMEIGFHHGWGRFALWTYTPPTINGKRCIESNRVEPFGYEINSLESLVERLENRYECTINLLEEE